MGAEEEVGQDSWSKYPKTEPGLWAWGRPRAYGCTGDLAQESMDEELTKVNMLEGRSSKVSEIIGFLEAGVGSREEREFLSLELAIALCWVGASKVSIALFTHF